MTQNTALGLEIGLENENQGKKKGLTISHKPL